MTIVAKIDRCISQASVSGVGADLALGANL